MRNVIVDYNEFSHTITIAAPTPELHERARKLPGVIELRKSGTWKTTATAAMAARIVRLYGERLEGTRDFVRYLEGRIAAQAEAHEQRAAKEWPEIPITSRQPEGTWMHQRRAFWFAFHLEAAMLNITMGGGKTKIAIDLMQNWKAQDVLIIAPLAGIDDAWEPHLIEHLMRLPAVALFRTQFNKMADFTEACRAMMNGDQSFAHRIAVVNHESFWREPFRSWAAGRQWDLIINDEIHREKSAGSLQSGFLFQLSSRARRRLGLTGTLMPHSPLDVYGQYRFLDRGILGTNNAAFLDRYAIKGGFEDREIVGFRNLKKLRERIDTITIHIDDSEQGLPAVAPPIEHKFDLEPKVRAVYDQLDEEFFAEVGTGQITAANAGVKLLRLHQIACGIAKLESGDVKRISRARLNALADVLQDFNRDEPIVVFARFKQDLRDIRELLTKLRRPSYLMGDGTDEFQRWKRRQDRPILVAQIQAIKESVDATRSSVGIFYSTGIYLGDYLQCRKRLHRPPQSRMVRFIHILARGTRDVTTFRALKDRRDVIEAVLRESKRAGRRSI